jgi:ABC-type multidrug transport system fused ATPase/permease subunit
MATQRSLSNRRHRAPDAPSDGRIDSDPGRNAHYSLRIIWSGTGKRMPQTLYAYIWRNSRRGQIILCVLTALVSFLTAVPLELQRRIVDDALPARSLTLLLGLAAAYLGVLLVQGGLKYALNVYRGRLVEEITRRLRLTIFDATRPRAADDHVHHGREPAEAGAIVSMVAAETEDLAGFVGDSFSFPLLQGGTAAFVVGYLLWVQPAIAVFGILLYLPQLVVVPVGQGAINRWSARHVRLVRQIGDLITLRFAPANGAGQAETETGAYRQLVDDSFVARITIYRIKFFLTAFGNFLDAVGPLIVLTVGGWLVMRGGVAVGTLVVFISGFQKLADPWDQLTNFYRMLSTARVKYRLIADTLPEGKGSGEIR